MAEYIERGSLMQKISRMIDYCEKDNRVNGLTALFQVGDAIMDCKSEDVAPVVHGRWIIGDGDDEFDVKCSVCEWTDIFDVCGIGMVKSIASEMHYCQNCGAKMDLGCDDNG